MRHIKLTAKEKKENVFVTLGRLRVAIRQDQVRALVLLEKVAADVSQMDLDLPSDLRSTF